MSNGTSDSSQHPGPEVDDLDAGDEYWAAAEGGFDTGGLWLEGDAGDLEKRSIWAVITGTRPPPQFSNCANAEAAIQELVRAIHPPCGLHWDSARAYWELIVGQYVDSQAFVEGFFEGACSSVEELVSESVFESARQWVEEGYRDDTLEPAQRFAEQYGDTWQSAYPEGCSSIFDVALQMAGPRDAERSDDTVLDFIGEFRLFHVFAARTEEFARRLIGDIVDRLPRRRPQAGGRTRAQQESQVDGAPQGDSDSTVTSQRQLRRIRLGPRGQPPTAGSEATTTPRPGGQPGT